jgi:hypothetical protein
VSSTGLTSLKARFVGIYWQQYGWVAPGEETSGLEDEYLLCGDKPKLIYVKKAAAGRDARLTGLLARIQADDGASYKPFGSAADLAGRKQPSSVICCATRMCTW